MKKLTLLAALLSVAQLSPPPAFAGAGSELPAVADCKMAPLTPQQLTGDEKVIFEKLPAGSAEARKFLYTRGYLRYARRVVDGSMQPLDLPCLPARDNWNRGYLTAEEARDILDVALGRKMVAGMKTDIAPPPALTLLMPQQLNADEKAALAKLPKGSDAERRFLYTRSFLRPCNEVVNRIRAPSQLPDLPKQENWDRRYLSVTESKQLVDVCLAMRMMAMMK